MNLFRPDFVLNVANKPPTPYYCSFYVELLLNNVETDKDHKARAVQYNEMILEARACRKFIISMITDLNNMLLIKSSRGQNDFIEHEESVLYGLLFYLNLYDY